ncbi:hypothetical protein P4133_21585 [Pseudomonas aeruginosa]|nr:hypothetical protein [Pseudomonas aeruginosa]MDF5999888.1 hypothetical protein [Pseudomonas aeruginosa]
MPKPLVGIVAGITPNIDALELNQDISLAAVAASTWAGIYAAHQPVEVIHSTYQAVHQSALEENYYNRLWLIPTTMGWATSSAPRYDRHQSGTHISVRAR